MVGTNLTIRIGNKVENIRFWELNSRDKLFKKSKHAYEVKNELLWGSSWSIRITDQRNARKTEVISS
jgi:hypothetical protein